MVSESNAGRCANKKAEPQRERTRGGVSAKTLGSERGGLGGPTLIGDGNECQDTGP